MNKAQKAFVHKEYMDNQRTLSNGEKFMIIHLEEYLERIITKFNAIDPTPDPELYKVVSNHSNGESYIHQSNLSLARAREEINTLHSLTFASNILEFKRDTFIKKKSFDTDITYSIEKE